jgi:hypothetical protein
MIEKGATKINKFEKIFGEKPRSQPEIKTEEKK